MKVVLVTDQNNSTGIGGYAWTLARYLSRAGVQVTLLYNGYFESNFVKSDFDILDLRLPNRTKSFVIAPVVRKLDSLLLRSYREYFKDSIVHFCGTDYSNVKFFDNSVVTIHDVRFDLSLNFISKMGIRNTFDSIYRDFINLKALGDVRSAKRVISISESTRVQLKKYGLDSQVIHHWIDLERFRSRDLNDSRTRLSLPVDQRLILNVSNNSKNKALDYLEKVANLIPKGYKIVKIGSPLKSENVLNVGKVSDVLYPFYFNAADLYLNVSTSEGFGRPQIEALASNLPVLARDIPINREVLGNGALYFDKTAKPANLADIILQTCDKREDNNLRIKMQKRKDELGPESSIEKYLEAYKSISSLSKENDYV